MIINLVSNAIKFTKRGSIQIVARFLADESLLQIKVTETGIGISRKMQEQMFQPFTQADASATRILSRMLFFWTSSSLTSTVTRF